MVCSDDLFYDFFYLTMLQIGVDYCYIFLEYFYSNCLVVGDGF